MAVRDWRVPHGLGRLGDLTATGLRGNDEQFELSTMPADSPEAVSQAERFERLTSSAIPLDAAESMAI